jgi:hypothetical protein
MEKKYQEFLNGVRRRRRRRRRVLNISRVFMVRLDL